MSLATKPLPPLAVACIENGCHKAASAPRQTVARGMLAGMLVALAGLATNVASFSLLSVSAQRMAVGAFFPFALACIVVLGGELFTGNILIAAGALAGRVRWGAMLKNWLWVYFGNWLGALLVAAGTLWSGKLAMANGQLALASMQTAAAKCAMTFGQAFFSGMFCNLLVCTGVLMAMAAADPAGKVIASYPGVALFALVGFEHSVANMYYIQAGLLAAAQPQYAALAAASGMDLSALTLYGFVAGNLIPASLGNIAGGLLLAVLMWGIRPATGVFENEG